MEREKDIKDTEDNIIIIENKKYINLDKESRKNKSKINIDLEREKNIKDIKDKT